MENSVKSIGIINPDRLQNIPARYWAQHEFCFHLHDLMGQLLVQMETQKAGHIRFEIESEEDRKLLASGIHVLDFLEKSGRGELERRAVINHLCNALYADMLSYIYEGLRALEKRKFSVAFTLLRKPFKESILIAAQMCADEMTFFDKMKFNAKSLLNRREFDESGIKALLESAIEVCRGASFTNADLIYNAAFNRSNDLGLAVLFDKATHLVTEYSKIQTENYNINFIFKNPEDNDVYQDGVYALLAMLLLFLNLMQIELYGRMRESNKKYKNWMLVTSVGAYEALFTSGRSRMAAFVNRNFKELLECPACANPLVIKKSDAARLFVGETIDCKNCLTSQHFPFRWLLSKFDLNLFDQ